MAAMISDLSKPVDDLISRSRRGDQAAFYKLYGQLSGFAYAILTRHLGPSPDVEDLMQQVFVKVYRDLPQFRGDKPFRVWLRRACFFVIYDHLRAAAKRPVSAHGQVIEEDLEKTASDPEEDLIEAEIRFHTHKILNRLGPEKRMALVMHDFEGHTLEEIAEILDCSKFTVRTRLVRARREFAARAKKDKELGQLLSRSVA